MSCGTSRIQVEQLPDRFVLTGASLRLEFARRDDRWQHSVYARIETGTAWSEILRSIEGTAEDSVPPSAALQDCFLQEIDAGTQELQLLGQAGKNVYSAAIRFNGPRNEIDFDFCLRAPATTGIPSVLASYEFPSFVAETWSLHCDGRICRIAASGTPSAELDVNVATTSSQNAVPLQLDNLQRILRIGGESAAEVTANAARRSLRWRYRLRLLASA